MLYEEVEKYARLSGDKNAWDTSGSRIGGYLDGYDKGIEILDRVRAEIESITPKAHIRTGKLSIDTELMIPLDRVLKVIDKYRAEGEG